MKLKTAMPIISIVLAFCLSVAAVSAVGAPHKRNTSAASDANASTSSETATSQPTPKAEEPLNSASDSLEMSIVSIIGPNSQSGLTDEQYRKIKNVVSINRVFDEMVYDDDALIEAAEYELIDKAEVVNGKKAIRQNIIEDFIKDLYGRTISGAKASDGYYIIPECEFSTITSSVTSVEQSGSTIKVKSDTSVNIGGSVQSFTVCTTLAPSDSGYGYTILAATTID